MHLIKADRLHQFVTAVFVSVGFPEHKAKLSADVLIEADLRGIQSHGVARLAGYLRLIDAGRLNPKASFTVHHSKPAIANANAGGGSGLVAAPMAMRIAIEKAELYGVGFCGVSNSNHFGIGAYHAMLAAKQHFIGFASTNASPLVAPFGGKERMLGTNPLAFAFPRKNHPPIVIDMATSAAANGKLEIAERAGKPIPKGWLLNKDGQDSEQPADLKAGGTLLPLGSFSSTGAHKGYALGALVDLLTGVLTGANWGPFVPPFVAFLQPTQAVGEGIGHMIGAIDPAAFQPIDSYFDRIEEWVDCFHNSSPIDADSPVLIPGDPEAALHAHHIETGIPIEPTVWAQLAQLAAEHNIPL